MKKSQSRSSFVVFLIMILSASGILLCFGSGYGVYRFFQDKFLQVSEQEARSSAEKVFRSDDSLIDAVKLEQSANCLTLAQKISDPLISQLSSFDGQGRMLCSLYRQKGVWQIFSVKNQAIFLNAQILKSFDQSDNLQRIENEKQVFVTTHRISISPNQVAYLEVVRDFSQSKMLDIIVLLLDRNFSLVASNSQDLTLLDEGVLSNILTKSKSDYVNFVIRGKQHLFLKQPLRWGTEDFFLITGRDVNTYWLILQDLKPHLFALLVVGMLIAILIGWVLSKEIYHPIRMLQEHLQTISKDKEGELRFLSMGKFKEFTEISDLFNQFNRNHFQKLKDLKTRIFELEDAKKSLIKLQPELVLHSHFIRAGEVVHGIAAHLQEIWLKSPQSMGKELETLRAHLTLSKKEIEKIDLTFQLETLLIELKTQKEMQNQVAQKFNQIPFVWGNPYELRRALQKILLWIAQQTSKDHKLKISLGLSPNSKTLGVQLLFQFYSEAPLPHLNPYHHGPLSIAWGLILRHKGQIQFDSPALNEYQLCVRLPVEQEGQEQKEISTGV